MSTMRVRRYLLQVVGSWLTLVLKAQEQQQPQPAVAPPNIILFIVDDLGWNQVGYHANPAGNHEIKTPSIDAHAAAGVTLDRGYMTPWCGPSRAAVMTGRTNSYNANVSTTLATFDDDIGYIGGLPAGTRTLASAFKEYGASIGRPYKAYYAGKWGIGGTSWANTALGMGFDEFRGFWGNGIEVCDGRIVFGGATLPFRTTPTTTDYGPVLESALPGYWEQDPNMADADWCDGINAINDGRLTEEEKFVACKTKPRTPPQHVDLDLLEKVTEQITNHDYENESLFQVYSTAMMHLPLAYPKKYDEDPDLPPYFRDGEPKPIPSIDDQRVATNNGVRFLDDLFESTMQAIKDAGQWENTIVYFTSDNGGAIYNGSANNNYPLRSSKFSPFEGGVRVVQFLSGGWIDHNLPADRRTASSTYLFPSDIGPTLLQMAGGNANTADFLLRGRTGATYGSPMFEYIKDSVDSSTPPEVHQKVRKVSYNKDIFFDVQSDQTLKHIYTGTVPQWTPRLWDPIWPKNGDLIMDMSYFSIQPCRPNGEPSDCCLLNVEEDWQESNPLPVDCHAMSLEAKQLFVIENGCPKNWKGVHMNPLCLEPGSIDIGALPATYSLWSQYGAVGPYTNSKGVPIDDFAMKCPCRTIDPDVAEDEVNFFTLPIFSPSECTKRRKFGFLAQGARCDGTFSFASPITDYIVRMADQLTSLNYGDIVKVEVKQRIALDLPGLVRTLASYATRSGLPEWPNFAKFPYVTAGLDSCADKGISPVPWAAEAMNPYMLGIRDPTTPRSDGYTVGLCAYAALNIWFCPSHDNPLLDPVKWDFGDALINDMAENGILGSIFGKDGILFGEDGLFDKDRDWGIFKKQAGALGRRPYGTFNDGRIFESLTLAQCLVKCPIRGQGTAYIGAGPHGLTV